MTNHNHVSRRQMLAAALPSAALAAGTVAPAIAIQRREHWDDFAQWVGSVEEVACVTTAERDAFIADRPEAASWHWMPFGDRHVGISPRRPGPHLEHVAHDPSELAKVYMERVRDVAASRTIHIAG